jgi:hypothetical protein
MRSAVLEAFMVRGGGISIDLRAESKGRPRRVCRALAAIFIVCGLAACATVSTIPMESQGQQRDARQARLYFIWPRSAMFRTATFDIKVDGKVVGKIAPDSYFFVDRPPGIYTLKVEPPFDWVYFETDVQVAAGGTYYYAINVKPATAPIMAVAAESSEL